MTSKSATCVNVKGPTPQKLFTYMRYNAELTTEGLSQLGIQDIKPERCAAARFEVERIPEMQRVGQAIAKVEVQPSQFDGFPPEKVGVADVS